MKPAYFDAAGGTARRLRFRLLRLTDEPDGVLRYLLTPEGLTAYLAMLDVDPALAQQAEEILIARLPRAGTLKRCLRLARRARTRTLELRETLRKHLLRAHRAGGAVHWSRETLPRIAEAIEHVIDAKPRSTQSYKASAHTTSTAWALISAATWSTFATPSTTAATSTHPAAPGDHVRQQPLPRLAGIGLPRATRDGSADPGAAGARAPAGVRRLRPRGHRRADHHSAQRANGGGYARPGTPARPA